MLLPSIFGEDLMDDWFCGIDHEMERMNQEFFGKKNPLYGKNAARIMKTDVREKDGTYEVAVDLPGFKKEDLQLTLEKGYLTIAASKGLDKNEEKDGRVIRRERYSGNMARSFYVGTDVREEDIKAKYESGVLTLTIPKKDEKKPVEEHKTIAIDG